MAEPDTTGDTRPADPTGGAAPTLPAFREGTVLGGYRLLGPLGAGGMGIVFAAVDTALGRRVAVKVLRPDLAADPTLRQRFLREARLTAQMEHDHVVRVYAVGEHLGHPFLVMEMLRGQSLRQRLREGGPLPLDEAIRVGRDVARGLAAAHAGGLVHRDVSPNNVWLEPSGRAKLLDFGLARTTCGDGTLTASGAVCGTPGFLAPEQAAGEKTDARTDLFSLGCVLYLLATGRKPFNGDGKSPGSEILAVLSQRPAPPRQRNPAVPAALDRLVMQMLAKAPDDRPRSAAGVAQALDALLSARPADPAADVPTETWVPGTRRHSASPRPRRRHRLAVLLAGGGAALVLATALVAFLRGGGGGGAGMAATVRPVSVARGDAFPPLDEVWAAAFKALPREQQPGELTAEFRRRNPDFRGQVLMNFGADGGVDGVKVESDAVTDLTTLRAVPRLAGLTCVGSGPRAGRLDDLRPLAGLTLSSLDVSGTSVRDLAPVRMLQLHSHIYYLCIEGTRVDSLEPLRRLPIQHLDLRHTPVTDLAPLADCRLEEVDFDWPAGPDPAPLKQCKGLKQINNEAAADFWAKAGQ